MRSNNLQAVLLAAGESSRMYPLADGNHKSMIRLLGKPLLEYTIEKLKRAGINNLIIVASNNKIESYFGDGGRFGVSIKYAIQDKPQGAGNALLLCRNLIENDFILLNSYHIDIDKFINPLIKAMTEGSEGALLVKERDNPQNFGVIGTEKERVTEVVEKPQKGEEPSNLCIVGIYLLNKSFIRTLMEVAPEHYQLETALNNFVKTHQVNWLKTQEETVVLKYPWNLFKIKDYLLGGLSHSIGKNVKISESAQISGEVHIEDGVQILEKAIIKGPCFLGKDCVIGTNSLVRKGCVIEQDAVVGGYMEIANSILMRGATTHSGFIGDSIIGDGTRIGAQFCSSNVRIDREPVRALVKDKEIETGSRHLGVIIGNNSRVGIKSSTMPGVIIGSDVIIGPSTTVLHNVYDGKKYYTKFAETVEK